MTIQITLDTKALNHFIASEGEEFKLEMRRAVISAAAASHKIFLNDDTKRLIDETVRKQFEEEVLGLFGRWEQIKGGYSNQKKFVLNPEIQAEIKAMAKAAVDEHDLINLARQEVHRNVNEAAGKIEERASMVQRHIESQIKDIIDKKMVSGINQYINDEVARRLEDAARLAGSI
jgi:hypothetical protein